MTKIRKDSFKKEEIELLLKIYAINSKDFIIKEFEKYGFIRSWQSLRNNAKKLGLKRDPEILKQEMIEGGSKAPCPPNKIPWTHEEDLILKNNYSTSSREEIEKLLPQRTFRGIRERALNLELRRNEEIVKQDRAKHLMENHGVTSTWEMEKVKEASRKTNLLKRGVEYPTQSPEVRAKMVETVRKNWGVDNIFQSETIKSLSIKTNLEKYGVENPQQNPEIQEKTRLTNQKMYGVDNPFQLVDRVKQGMIEKYGADSPLKVPEIKEKQQKTNLEKYGYITPSQNSDVLFKIYETNIKKYGFFTPLKNEEIKEKIKKTIQRLYGVDNAAKSEIIKAKIKATTLSRYGVESFLNLEEIREKGFAVIKKNKSFNKSKEEEKFLDFLKKIDPEVKHHVEHPDLHHIIDFYLPKYDLWVQYDGVYWHGKMKRSNITRQSLKILKTIERDEYQNNLINNLIRFWSDDVKNAIENENIINLINNTIDNKIKKYTPCHQFIKKQEWIKKDLESLNFDPKTILIKDFDLSEENLSTEIIEFIQKYEWLGTLGVYPKWCFTARYKGYLGGVVLINEPTAYSKILGESTPLYEALIQRGATASWTPKNLGSRLIMFSCNWMTKNTEKRAFVAYADPSANEIGTIYQACNFNYLGNNFGNIFLYRHPDIREGKIFSSQTLKRTSSFKKWCKKNKIKLKNDWFKENEFKDLNAIPEDIKESWHTYNNKILNEAEKIPVEKKHKYVLLLGMNKKDKKFLLSLKDYKTYPYPKRLYTPAP